MSLSLIQNIPSIIQAVSALGCLGKEVTKGLEFIERGTGRII